MPTAKLPDGLMALQAEMDLGAIMRLIERTARWVDPKTFALLPVWYPEHARRGQLYNANWSTPRTNRNRASGLVDQKREGNAYANKALTYALGLRRGDRTNWSCCHIWGLDDPRFQTANAVVQDRRFFSCVANMVLLPTPLKAFTDTVPEVKLMLRICAKTLYGWHCDHDALSASVKAMKKWADWTSYPESWPKPGRSSSPLGMMPINEGIRSSAQKRLRTIRSALKSAGDHYPREAVIAALTYWNIPLSD